MPLRYSGAKRARYQRACDDYIRDGITQKDALIKMFVKPERFNPDAKVCPDPRAIQFRGAKYCVALARFLHPIEEHIYELTCCSAGVPQTRNVAKGLNSVTRAELLCQKASYFDDPVFISLDASRFDKHVDDKLLAIEHSIYLKSNGNLEFMMLLSWQLVNHCFTNLGMVYKVKGRRMSGDMNTAVGNCLLMLMMLLAFFTTLGITKWDTLDDGDDSVSIVERRDLDKVLASAHSIFLTFGHEIKVEKVTDDLSKVVFCQCSMIEYAPGRRKFVREFRAVMSKSLTGVRHWDNNTYRRKVLIAIGTCELVLCLGVPVLQEFALAILRNAKRGLLKPIDLADAPEGLRKRALRDLRNLGVPLHALEAQPVMPCARSSFATAFDYPEHLQIILEERLKAWVFEVDGLTFEHGEINVPTWEYNPCSTEIYRY
jgi:hypothetical protein